MNKFRLNAIVLAVSLAFSAGAMAEGISKDDNKAGKEKIAAEYKVARAGCDSLSGNAKDICVAEAKGKAATGKAELAAAYKPSVKADYEVRIARAKATHAVAQQRCDDKAGNVKDVCAKEAKAALTVARADAKAQMKTIDANAMASAKTEAARQDASADKREAGYAVAKEKCDTYSGDAKDNCIKQAKADFGQY